MNFMWTKWQAGVRVCEFVMSLGSTRGTLPATPDSGALPRHLPLNGTQPPSPALVLSRSRPAICTAAATGARCSDSAPREFAHQIRNGVLNAADAAIKAPLGKT